MKQTKSVSVGSTQAHGDWRSLTLWDHQIAAVELIRRFLKDYAAGTTKGSALIQMPTGSGKTGVIAVVAQCLKEVRTTLVLSPRTGLCRQLSEDIAGAFFDGLQKTRDISALKAPSLTMKPVVLWKSGRKLPKQDGNPQIIVGTLQKLLTCHKNRAAECSDLARRLDVVLVDEGHYEPAPEWGDAVRQMDVPRVLFSATPFRNDLKMFDVDARYVYTMSYKKACDDRFVREIVVVPGPEPHSPADFVVNLLREYARRFGLPRHANKAPRVIVRCDTAQTIREIAATLRKRGMKTVAIHETFEDKPLVGEYKHVPNPRKLDAIFWVHQFKLLEGIDDRRFQLVAPYEELKSARSVVQQVGRVIRNPSRAKGAKAYLFDCSRARQAALWKSFLEYDRQLEAHGFKILESATKWIEETLDLGAAFAYTRGRFSQRFVLKNCDPSVDLRYPFAANIYRRLPGFDIATALRLMEKQFRDADTLFVSHEIDERTRAIIFIAFQESRLLRSGVFLEPRLGIQLIREDDDFVFFLDTSGGAPPPDSGLKMPVVATHLKKLFAQRDDVVLNTVSSVNSDMSQSVVRARTISAASIRETSPYLDDHSFVCTNVRGRFSKLMESGKFRRVGRYLGFGNGRVSDSCGGEHTYEEYSEWLTELSHVLKSGVRALHDFKRFALETSAPPDPAPTHVLLNLSECYELFVTNDIEGMSAGDPVDIKDTAAEVSRHNEGYRFCLICNDRSCTVDIAYDSVSRQYRLESRELEELYVPVAGGPDCSLVGYLNQGQLFRVLPVTPGFFYSTGSFFKPDLLFGSGYDDEQIGLLGLLHPVSQLAGILSEKGEDLPPDRMGWSRGSLFHLIDRLGKGTSMSPFMKGSDIVVCDDLGTESADFILVRSRDLKAMFIHAKASSSKAPCSASKITEVCGQATKNARYLSRFSNDPPPKAHLWHSKEWTNKSTGPFPRIRKGPDGEGEAWSAIKGVIRNLQSENEICIVLGGILSKKALEEGLKKDPPVREAVQIAYLLLSTAEAAYAVGAKLRVFCMP